MEEKKIDRNIFAVSEIDKHFYSNSCLDSFRILSLNVNRQLFEVPFQKKIKITIYLFGLILQELERMHFFTISHNIVDEEI